MSHTTFRGADGLSLDSYIATVSTSCAIEQFPHVRALVCSRWNDPAWSDDDQRYYAAGSSCQFLPHETGEYISGMHDLFVVNTTPNLVASEVAQAMLGELRFLTEFCAIWEDYQ